MLPKQIGHYQIIKEIGRGGMATVFDAYDPRFERSVAIKVLPREFLHDAQSRARFEQEAKTVALLEHPAIVPVYDFGEYDGQPYIVMRWMNGGSLADKLKKGPLSPVDAVKILNRLAQALDFAHSKGMIHRDLKPGNILFDQYDHAFLSDFGIAQLKESGGAMFTGSMIIGTPAYMSPELIQGEKSIDGRSDIYALGVISFEMLSNQRPFQAETPAKEMIAHIIEPIPSILMFREGLPPSIDDVLDKALAKDPNERFQTAGEFARAFNEILNVQEGSSRPVVSSHASPPIPNTTPKAGPPILGSPHPTKVSTPSVPGKIPPINKPSFINLIAGGISSLLSKDAKPVPKNLSVLSIAYPRNLSKRYTTTFLIQIFAPESRAIASSNILSDFGPKRAREQVQENSPLFVGQTIKAKLFHSELAFSDPVIKLLDKDINVIRFTGKPSDNCHPGIHQVILSITDAEKGNELVSASFPVQVTDFVFDHVSRPFLSSLMAGLLGVGSFVMFVLTLLGQMDSTFGYTTGTTAGAIASVIYWNFFAVYKRSSGKSWEKIGV